MKKISLIILCTLIIALAAPVHVATPFVSQGDTTIILTLDVCSPQDSSLSGGNNEMPSIYECTCRMVPLAFAGFHRTSNPLYPQFLIPFQKERPPKV